MFFRFLTTRLNHFRQERVDEVLPASEVTALDKVVGLLAEATGGSVQLEGPQEVGGVLEVGSNGDDLVDQIFDANDAESAQVLLMMSLEVMAVLQPSFLTNPRL